MGGEKNLLIKLDRDAEGEITETELFSGERVKCVERIKIVVTTGETVCASACHMRLLQRNTLRELERVTHFSLSNYRFLCLFQQPCWRNNYKLLSHSNTFFISLPSQRQTAK